MTDIETLKTEADRLIHQEPLALPEIRKMIVEMDELINSPDFQNFDREQRGQLQNLYKELRARLRGPESSAAAQPVTAGILAGDGGAGFNLPRLKEREHNPQAETIMQEAEKLFYGGRYAEAIRIHRR